jgi:hypothetical protein
LDLLFVALFINSFHYDNKYKGFNPAKITILSLPLQTSALFSRTAGLLLGRCCLSCPSFFGKDRQAAHAGGDYSKLIVEIGVGKTAFPNFGNYFSMFMAAFWIFVVILQAGKAVAVLRTNKSV